MRPVDKKSEMVDFVEAVHYAPRADDQIIVTAFPGSAVGLDEVEIDAKQYRETVKVHYRSPLHVAVRRYLIGAVLRVEPEIRRGGRAPQRSAPSKRNRSEDDDDASALDNFVLKRWIDEQGPKIMGEVWTLGLACLRLQRDPDTDWPVPYVHRFGLGDDYKITIRPRIKPRSVQYRFYLLDRRTNMRGSAHRDKKTIVYDGFDADPSPFTGELSSVVASLLGDEYYHDEVYRISRAAQINMARPMILVETTRGTPGMGQERAEPPPIEGGQDFVEEERRRRVAIAEVGLDVMIRQQAAFWREYYDQAEETVKAGETSVHQAHNNIFPLPPDARSASYQAPSMRQDWRDVTEIYEDRVTSTYGLQRAHLHSSMGRLQVSETLTNASLVNVINQWRDNLSRIFTDLYRRAFDGDGEIVFPKEVNDTPAGLYEKWQQRLITWDGYKTLVGAMTGIDERYMEKVAPPRDPLQATAAATSTTAKKKVDPKPQAKRKRDQNGTAEDKKR
jgi:hypothetical protein